MPQVDMPLEKLKTYEGRNPKPADFDQYWDKAIAEMKATNANLELKPAEFKTPAAGTATVPASREGMTMKVLAEGPRAIAYRTTAGPTFQEPAGTKHEYDQVVIALSPAKMSLSLDGKPARTDWKRGDVFCAPGWRRHTHRATSDDAVLLRVSDEPVHKALGFLREE